MPMLRPVSGGSSTQKKDAPAVALRISILAPLGHGTLFASCWAMMDNGSHGDLLLCSTERARAIAMLPEVFSLRPAAGPTTAIVGGPPCCRMAELIPNRPVSSGRISGAVDRPLLSGAPPVTKVTVAGGAATIPGGRAILPRLGTCEATAEAAWEVPSLLGAGKAWATVVIAVGV